MQEFGLCYLAEDVVAYDFMKTHIALKESHYVLPSLWQNPAKVLPASLPMLRSAYLELNVDWSVTLNCKKLMYCKEMRLLLNEGYAEIVPETERNRTDFV